jgi:hypothetical protein
MSAASFYSCVPTTDKRSQVCCQPRSIRICVRIASVLLISVLGLRRLHGIMKSKSCCPVLVRTGQNPLQILRVKMSWHYEEVLQSDFGRKKRERRVNKTSIQVRSRCLNVWYSSQIRCNCGPIVRLSFIITCLGFVYCNRWRRVLCIIWQLVSSSSRLWTR